MRRLFLLVCLLGFAALAGSLWAQQPGRVPVVGTFAAGTTGTNDPVYEVLRQGLRDLGYTEGRDYLVVHRAADGHLDRLTALAEELVRLKVDVIVTGTDEATRAAKRATSTIPIVAILYNHDPVASGLIDSFNRPGGNITGLTVRNTELAAKRLQLLKDMIPGLSHVTVFSDSFGQGELDVLRPAARILGVQLRIVEVKSADEFALAFKTAKLRKAGAVMVLTSPLFYANSARLGALALENKLPTMGVFRAITEAGGLMSYSTDVRDAFRRAPYFIDRIFKGTKASELPFEQNDIIKLVVNLKTAKALGLTVPESILVFADEVIR